MGFTSFGDDNRNESVVDENPVSRFQGCRQVFDVDPDDVVAAASLERRVVGQHHLRASFQEHIWSIEGLKFGRGFISMESFLMGRSSRVAKALQDPRFAPCQGKLE